MADQPVVPPTSPTAMPIGKKENASVSADQIAKQEGDEYWEQFAQEIEVEKKVAELGGVEKIASGEVKIPDDVAAEMGVKPTITIETPIAQATGFSIRGVALDDNQLSAGVQKPVSSGFRWLVEWFIYHLRKAHYFVKKMKGKVWRQPLPSST